MRTIMKLFCINYESSLSTEKYLLVFQTNHEHCKDKKEHLVAKKKILYMRYLENFLFRKFYHSLFTFNQNIFPYRETIFRVTEHHTNISLRATKGEVQITRSYINFR